VAKTRVTTGNTEEPETRPEQPAREEEVVQPEGQVEHLEERELTEKVARIEQKLSRDLGRNIRLTDKQKEVLRSLPTKGITEAEFILAYSHECFLLRNEPHDEIMRELDEILPTIEISEDGTRVQITVIDHEGNPFKSTFQRRQ
jgi:hypothetical protein